MKKSIVVLVVFVLSLWAALWIPLHYAGAAQPTERWVELGYCESGMDPAMVRHVRDGRGRLVRYEGFASFDSRTWDAYRLPEFAVRANEAHIFEQVWVAEAVLAAEGWGAWPWCSSRLGFASPAADVVACMDPSVDCGPDDGPCFHVPEVDSCA